MYLFQCERLRLRQGGVTRAGLSNLCLDLLVVSRQVLDLFGDGISLRVGVRAVQELYLLLRAGIELLLQDAFTFD